MLLTGAYNVEEYIYIREDCCISVMLLILYINERDIYVVAQRYTRQLVFPWQSLQYLHLVFCESYSSKMAQMICVLKTTKILICHVNIKCTLHVSFLVILPCTMVHFLPFLSLCLCIYLLLSNSVFFLSFSFL